MKRVTFKRTLLVMLALVVLVGGMFAILLFGPSTPIAVSKKTTYLSEPRDQFGHIDYFEAIRSEQKRGVSVDDNAAVLLWQAWGRRDVAPSDIGPHFRELGIPVPSEDGNYLVGILDDETVAEGVHWLESLRSGVPDVDASGGQKNQDFAQWNQPNRPDLRDVFEKLASRAMDHPWQSRDLPPLAEWLQQNETPIELIFEATKRPQMYAPLVRPEPDGEFGSTLIHVLLTTTQNCRGAARALAARSMWHLGEGNVDAAWEDAMACHRLSRLVSRSPILVDQLIAIAIDNIAFRLDLAILEQPLTNEQIDRIRRDLAGLAPCCDMARSIDRGERFMFLDVATSLSRGVGISELMGNRLGGVAMGLSIDWNVPLQMGNELYDEIVAAASLSRFADRRAAIEKAEARFEQLMTEGMAPKQIAMSVISRRIRSEVVGSAFASLMIPAVTAATSVEDRSNTYDALTKIAAELAAYRTERGTYPEKLEALGEGIFAKLPLDLFTESPFRYERRGEGYLLYSVGPNQQDDGASSSVMNLIEGVEIDGDDRDALNQIDPDSDDYAIRLPLPPFSWSERIANAIQKDGDEDGDAESQTAD